MDNWNDDWRDELEKDDYDCYIRLCDCNNYKRDIKKIAKLMYKYNPNKDKNQCLDRTIEWITGWNTQPHLIPDDEEYKKIIDAI